MNPSEIWALLGVPPTKDAAEIREAYLKALPDHHPEDDPAGFLKLRAGYEEALKAAGDSGPAGGEREADDPIAFAIKAILDDFPRRMDEAAWRGVLNVDANTGIDRQEDVSEKLLTALMDDYYLPRRIWRYFDEAFAWSARASRLKETFHPRFIEYVLDGARYERAVRDVFFDYSRDAGEDFDGFIDACYKFSKALQENDMGEAARLVAQNTGKLFAHPDYRLLIARMHTLRGEYGQSLAILRELDEAYPNDPYILAAIGGSLLNEEKFEAALAVYLRILDADAGFYAARLGAARARLATGALEEAKANAYGLLMDDPCDVGAMGLFGAANEALVPIFRGRLDKDAGDADARYKLASCCFNLGDHAAAFGLIADETPDEAHLAKHCELYADLYILTHGELTEEDRRLLLEYVKAWEENETDRQRFRFLPDKYLRLGMDEAALQKADVLLREFPGDPEICRVKAAIFQRRSDSHAAFRAIAEGLAQNPSHAGLLSVEALLLEETGNLDTAANSAEASLRSYPYNLSMWELLGRLYERSGKYGEVLKVVQRAEAAGLCGSGLSLMKAVALFETDGPKEEAQALFEEAKGLYPDKEAVLEKLGILYARGGRVSEAAELFDRLIELRETPYAYLLRGWLFANFPKTTDSFGKARARLNFKKAIELDGHYAPAWYQLGVLAYDEGQMEEASADFQRTLDADPGFSDVHLYLAIAHKASGDIESALRALDEGMALAKENDEAAYNRLFLKKSDFLYEDHRYEALAALGEAPAAGADEEQPQYSRIGMFAYACYEIGDDVRAEALFQEALAALPAGKEPSDADRKQLYVRYAEFLQTAKRDPEAALPYFAHAYEGSDTFRDVVELARAYAAAGRQKEAEKLYRARLSMRRGGAAFQKPQNPAKDRADTACADCMTGECFFGLGMYRQAKRHLLRAVRDAGNCTLCAKRVCHEALFALAKISLAEGDPEAARAYYGHVVSAVRDRAYLEAAALFGSGQGV